MSLSYADEKFSNAVRLLAKLPGGIRERLIDACIYEIGYVQAERDVPEEMREDFNEFKARLTSKSPTDLGSGEGQFHATIRAMSEDEAIEVAEDILSFAYRFEQLLEIEQSKPIKVRKTKPAH